MNITKGLITAAGLGRRMNFSLPQNKVLLEVGGKRLIDHALESFSENGIAERYVIVGHCADLVESVIGGRAGCLLNERYADTGIIYSIYLAKEQLYGESFVLMMGDLLHHPKMVSACLQQSGTIVVTYEEKSEYVPEDSKVVVKDGRIDFMSKDIPAAVCSGEFGHMMKFDPEGSKMFFDEIGSFLARGENKVYLMDVINELISRGIIVSALNVTGIPRIEIDFEEDLEKARQKIYPQLERYKGV